MRNFPGKKIGIKVYDRLRISVLTRKARRQYPDFDRYIFRLWAQNFGVALEISALRRLETICETIKPRFVFDVGSGVSTAILAKYAQKEECEVFALDEDFRYLTQAYSNAMRKYLTSQISFIYGPKNYRDFFENFKMKKSLDLIIIDGPSRDRYNETARRFYLESVSSKTTCIIDDTDRTETDAFAQKLARENSLKKFDYRDAFYSTRHQYSILVPHDLVQTLQNSL